MKDLVTEMNALLNRGCFVQVISILCGQAGAVYVNSERRSALQGAVTISLK